MADPKPLSADEVLARVPQQPPFRFIDEILELDAEHILAGYRFREDADFYRGHFPGNPITPGVILLETMAQAGVVALGLYLASVELSPEEMEKIVTVFTDANVDFANTILPGERVLTTGTPVFFRRRKLQSRVEMKREDGTIVCSGVISGMGIMQ